MSVESVREQMGFSSHAVVAANASKDLKCKGDYFRTWYAAGTVPSGEIETTGIWCESPCTADCLQMLDHQDFRVFSQLREFFKFQDWGVGSRCSYLSGNQRRRCKVIITDAAAVSKALWDFKQTAQGTVVSPLERALSHHVDITVWTAKARRWSSDATPPCGCSFCAASVAPAVLADEGHEYEVVGRDRQCITGRGYQKECSQYLREFECSCAQCFGGTDEDDAAQPSRWSYLLGGKTYAGDVARAMRDLMEKNMGEGTCGGQCEYDRSLWKGQQ